MSDDGKKDRNFNPSFVIPAQTLKGVLNTLDMIEIDVYSKVDIEENSFCSKRMVIRR